MSNSKNVKLTKTAKMTTTENPSTSAKLGQINGLSEEKVKKTKVDKKASKKSTARLLPSKKTVATKKTSVKKAIAVKTAPEKKAVAVKTAPEKKAVAVKTAPDKKAVAVKTLSEKNTGVENTTVEKKPIVEKTDKLPKINVSIKKKIIYLCSECAPFIATGGLADVMGSLPKTIAKNKDNDVSVILPLYSNINEQLKSQFKFLINFNVSVGWRSQYVGVFLFECNGVKYYFIDNEYYFKREGNIYGFYDDGERFAFFSRACLDAIARLDIYPDILHCNDWQTAGSIIYLKGLYYGDEKFRRIKTIFTIHNIEYQGIFGMDTYESLFGFTEAIKNFVEFDGNVNLMKAAIEMTDYVSTVSPTYANEIKYAYFAKGLENIINRNAHKLCGILNGIDVDFYNPETDKCLFKNYSINNMSGKEVCKKELQKMLGLPERNDVPIIAIISRLVSHKGLDLVRCTIENILTEDVQVVILGKGEVGYETYFTDLSNSYKGKCVSIIAFNQDLSRKIYSGADIFLMPSKTEPCGLSQMIASRYGTVPVVRETGGLNDSIKALSGDSGNGFTFHDYNAGDMLYVLKQAVNTYRNKNEWTKLQNRVMSVDFSWNVSAKEYEKLYNK